MTRSESIAILEDILDSRGLYSGAIPRSVEVLQALGLALETLRSLESAAQALPSPDPAGLGDTDEVVPRGSCPSNASRIQSSFDWSPLKVVTYLKDYYPNHLIFVQVGRFFDVYDQDARDCGALFGWKLYEHRHYHLPATGVSVDARQPFVELVQQGRAYVTVKETIGPQASSRKVLRCIEEVFTP